MEGYWYVTVELRSKFKVSKKNFVGEKKIRKNFFFADVVVFHSF